MTALQGLKNTVSATSGPKKSVDEIPKEFKILLTERLSPVGLKSADFYLYYGEGSGVACIVLNQDVLDESLVRAVEHIVTEVASELCQKYHVKYEDSLMEFTKSPPSLNILFEFHTRGGVPVIQGIDPLSIFASSLQRGEL
jgi:hypothetical protein